MKASSDSLCSACGSNKRF